MAFRTNDPANVFLREKHLQVLLQVKQREQRAVGMGQQVWEGKDSWGHERSIPSSADPFRFQKLLGFRFRRLFDEMEAEGRMPGL